MNKYLIGIVNKSTKERQALYVFIPMTIGTEIEWRGHKWEVVEIREV